MLLFIFLIHLALSSLSHLSILLALDKLGELKQSIQKVNGSLLSTSPMKLPLL